MAEICTDDYGLSRPQASSAIAAPDLPYRPTNPRSSNPAIGLIGCGGIAAQHLNAYRHAGFNVLALCDHTESKARNYLATYYPNAFVTTDYRELLKLDEIEVVDIATHPEGRIEIIETSLLAGKHVLSQKPFVVDLDVGERLADLAESQNVKLAVNQNGRWSPHFSYIRQAIRTGLIGNVVSATFTIHWDHSWIIGTAYEQTEELILYDFGIHWFDLASHLFDGRTARRVSAQMTRALHQSAQPPMLAQAIVGFDGGQAAFVFNANVTHGQEDRTFITGTKGSLTSEGPSLSEQTVTLHSPHGYARPKLEGTWFREGFHGAMGELLCAIEEARMPVNNARDNLRSLALCFAAVASARDGLQKIPGEVRTLNHERSNQIFR